MRNVIYEWNWTGTSYISDEPAIWYLETRGGGKLFQEQDET